MLKYGLKIWSTNKDWFKQANDLIKSGDFDFIELYIVPKELGSFKEPSSLKNLAIFKSVPIIIHTPHFEHDFNIFELNNEKIKLFKEQVIKTADFLDSKYIVVHAGIGDSKEKFKENIAKIFDKRLLIENMEKIGIDDSRCFGYTLEQLKFIKQECGFDVCLDFGHTAKSAFSQKLDYKKFTQNLISVLNPVYFHICGNDTQTEKDEHRNLWEGDFDIKWAKKILLNLAEKKEAGKNGKDIYIVFEIPKQGAGLQNDIKNVKYFKNLACAMANY